MKEKRLIYSISLIMIAVILALFRSSRGTISVSASDRELIVTGPLKEERFVLAYNEIEEIFLLETLDEGQRLSGYENSYYMDGIWENQEYGEYRLCIKKNTKNYIVVKLVSGIFVFNYQRESSTVSLFEALKAATGKSAADICIIPYNFFSMVPMIN